MRYTKKGLSCFFFFFLLLEGLCFLLGGIAFVTLLERKLLASVQRRRGPTQVGFFGLLQPFADGLKLVMKELIFPSSVNIFLFISAPLLTFFFTLLLWFSIPLVPGFVFFDFPFSLFFVFAIGSFSVYGIVFAGWASNSKYALLGGIRSAAQMLAYELCLCFIFLSTLLVANDATLSGIVYAQSTVWFLFPLWPFFFFFLIVGLAETNRAPFDLPEAEAELVAGYNVEYSAVFFCLFFFGGIWKSFVYVVFVCDSFFRRVGYFFLHLYKCVCFFY